MLCVTLHPDARQTGCRRQYNNACQGRWVTERPLNWPEHARWNVSHIHRIYYIYPTGERASCIKRRSYQKNLKCWDKLSVCHIRNRLIRFLQCKPFYWCDSWRRALTCLTELLPKPVRSREKPLASFLFPFLTKRVKFQHLPRSHHCVQACSHFLFLSQHWLVM